MSIDKRLIIETFENKSIRSIKSIIFKTKELTKYKIVFSKTNEKANLIDQRLKKRANQLEKKLRS